MIVGPRFPGDDNEPVMLAQHDEYFPVISEWGRRALKRLEYAEELTGGEDGLADRLRGRRGFDHRVLQEAHDLIAAWDRFSQCRWLPLFDPAPDRAALRAAWREFASAEIGRLIEDARVTKALLEAIGHENEPAGYAAEKWLGELLRARYAEMFAGRNEQAPEGA